VSVCSGRCGGLRSGACSSAGAPAGGQAPWGAVGHSFAGGMECCDSSRWARSIKRGDHAVPGPGGHDYYDPRPPRASGPCSCRGLGWGGQAADVAVAQPEEDQLGQLAGGGDDADVAAAAGGDVVADLVGVENTVTSCDLQVLVYQATEPVSS
jgi:hypothetical protein